LNNIMETDGHISLFMDQNPIIGSGPVPNIILGPGAGAGSAVVTGTTNGFTVTLTAGAGTTNNSIVFTIIFAQPFTVIPHTVFSAGNTNTAATSSRHWLNNNSLNSFDFMITTPRLNSGQVYIWKFITL